jgi:hypothetical protein
MIDDGHRGTAVERRRSTVETLPSDARDRVALIEALTGNRRAPSRESFQVDDSDDLITIEVLIDDDDDALHQELLGVVADVRCFGREGRTILQARFFRDGRRDQDDEVVTPADLWPAGDSTIAVDFHDAAPCSPRHFETLLDLAEAADGVGRTVYFLNVPPCLRMHAEVCGAPFLVPIKREKVGPHLPEVLTRPREQA